MVDLNRFKHKQELCETCEKSYGGGCPIWPTLRATYECVEYKLSNTRVSENRENRFLSK